MLNATLYTNGTIVALQGPDSVATFEAMVVVQDTIAALGSANDLRSNFPGAQVYNLNGNVLLPGFVDSHAHVYELGWKSAPANVNTAATEQEMVQAIQSRYPDRLDGQWLIGQGWDEGAWASRGYPDRAALDSAFPNNPVYLYSLHGFAALANGPALAAAGLNDQSADPEAGRLVRRANGSLSGVLENLAQDVVEAYIPPPTQAQIQAATLEGLRKMAKAGVTMVHEAGMDTALTRAYVALAQQRKLPMRVFGLLSGNQEPLVQEWLRRGPSTEGLLYVGGFKVYFDGSLGSRSALMKAPYYDKPKAANPTVRISVPAMEHLARRAQSRGFQLAVHTIGDLANDTVLTMFENLWQQVPNHRWRFEHAQVVLPNFYERAARIGAVASMQPSHAVGDSPWAENRVGPERIQHAYAWRNMLDAGVPLLLNSDLPGEPWEPMETLYFAVNRKRLDAPMGQAWYPEQAVTVTEALWSMTYMGAWAAFQEEQTGLLKVGYQADFVELNRNPLTVGSEALNTIQVLNTWVAGQRVE